MRITGGKFRSRPLAGKIIKGVRPSGSKTRQAIFNILGNDLTGLSFLDGFCGSGIMGFEALSRGASRVTFIDKSRPAMQILKQNLMYFHIPDSHYALVTKPIEKAIGSLQKASFDLIYIDPPYALLLPKDLLSMYQNLVDQIGRRGLLKKDGVLLMEHPGRALPNLKESDFQVIDHRQYGNVGIQFLRFKF